MNFQFGLSGMNTNLVTGQIFPDMALPSKGGAAIRISDYRQRSNVVLVVCGPEEWSGLDGLLVELDDLHSQFVQESTQVLVLLPAAPWAETYTQRGSRFPILTYLPEQLPERLRQSIQALTIFILDRYSEIAAICQNGARPDPYTGAELLEEVRFIELACPE